MARRLLVLTALVLAASACGSTIATVEDQNQPTSTATTVSPATTSTTPATTTSLIDSQAIIDRYGFEVCGIPLPQGDVTPERAQEIYSAAVEAGIGSSASLGTKVAMYLHVLDDPSLAKFAEIADPSEACVGGQDPNDYVEPGPQTLGGDGWRWVGAGGHATGSRMSLITTQAEYDDLWALLGEGPELGQVAVDFNREAILTLGHGSGVNFGSCGARIDGVSATEDGVVVDWFRPGGEGICTLALVPATYAIAIDLETFGEPPLQVGLRHGPRETVREFTTVSPGSFAVTTTAPPRTDPPETFEPTTTLPPVVPETAPPIEAASPEGERSTVLFETRIGGPDLGFDAPLLPEWESSERETGLSTNIVGRGGFTVDEFSINDDAWKFAVAPGERFFVESGPTAIAVPTYRLGGESYVTTGESLPGHEYRYHSDETIVERVVRWFERDDKIVVVAIGYPNFESIQNMIPDPNDKIMQTLTGYSPDEILNDIRFFE